MKNYSVYMHTSPNGKVYIGITCISVKKRWSNGNGYSHNKHFTNAIQKYGWENIEHTILFDGLSKDEACAKEIELITLYKSNNQKYGYNITSGGEHYTHSEESKKKIGEKSKGRHHSEETKRKLSEMNRGANNYLYGKHLSEETKRKLSEAKKGQKAWNKGVPLSEGQKRKMDEFRIKKKVVCVETGAVYPSVRGAAKELHINPSHISEVCKGKSQTSGGYHWKYYEEE